MHFLNEGVSYYGGKIKPSVCKSDFQDKNHCWAKGTYRLVSVLPENIVIIPKTLGEILCGLTRQQLNFLEGVCATTSGTTVTQYFRKGSLQSQSQETRKHCIYEMKPYVALKLSQQVLISRTEKLKKKKPLKKICLHLVQPIKKTDMPACIFWIHTFQLKVFISA